MWDVTNNIITRKSVLCYLNMFYVYQSKTASVIVKYVFISARRTDQLPTLRGRFRVATQAADVHLSRVFSPPSAKFASSVTSTRILHQRHQHYNKGLATREQKPWPSLRKSQMKSRCIYFRTTPFFVIKEKLRDAFRCKRWPKKIWGFLKRELTKFPRDQATVLSFCSDLLQSLWDTSFFFLLTEMRLNIEVQSSRCFWGSSKEKEEATKSAEGSLEHSAMENIIMPSVLWRSSYFIIWTWAKVERRKSMKIKQSLENTDTAVQLSLHFPTRFTDRWGTIVLLNVVDKVILVRGSGNVSRGWRWRGSDCTKPKPAGWKQLLQRRIPPRDANIIIQLCHNSYKNSKPGCVFVRSRVRRGLGGALDRRVHKRKNWRQCHCDLEARSLRLCRRHCNSAGLHHTGAESAASSRYSKGKSGHVWLRVRLKTPGDLMETPWFRLLCWWGLNAWMTAGKTLGSPYN